MTNINRRRLVQTIGAAASFGPFAIGRASARRIKARS